MRNVLFAFLLQFILSNQVTAQNDKRQNFSSIIDNIIKVDEEADFPGGETAWRKYLIKNLKIDIPVRNNAPEGTYTVVVRFIVNPDGSLDDIVAETKHGYGMEMEVMRIISNTKKWIPAKQGGEAVTAYRRQPVTFVIVDEGRKRSKRD